jgi:tetratricopeptide (TPR) repeat protein
MKKQTPSHRSQAPKLFGLFLALFFGWHLVMGQEPKSIQPLGPNQSLEREMSGKETHRYKVNLQRGEFFQVRVEQKGIDVVLLLHDAEGNELARMDSPNGDRGFEILSFVAESSASFMLEVKSLDEKAGKGAYAIHREVSRTATVEDRKQAATEREQQTQRARLETLTSEVLALLDKIKPSTPPNIFNAALNKAGQGLAIAQSLKSVEHELLFSFMTARIFEKKGENQGALENYESTLKVIDSNKARMAEMKSIEVTVLKKMGRFYENNLVDSEAAAKLYYRALSLYKEGEEDEDKGLLLRYFGDVLDDFRFYTQAAESYLKAIRVFQNLKLKFELGATYGKLGRVYFEQGNKPAEALKYLLEAEDILEDSPLNSEYQETRLYNLGFIYMLYDRLNDPERAAFYRNKASALEAKTNEPFVVFGNKLMLGISLSESGKTEEAAKVYRNALELAKNLSGPEKVTAQTQILTLLGNLCLRTGKGDEAQKFFDQAVNLLKDLDDHTALAGLYEDFGDTLFNGGAFKLAEQYYGKAYSILSDSKGRPKQVDFEQVAGVVNKLGKAQLENGNQSGGIVTLRTALNVEMSLYQQTKLADLLQDRMTAFTQMNKRKLAIFFGKQAVMLKQEMRRTLKKFPIETQKSFLKKNRETYEHLIVLLLQENRLAEAVQIMRVKSREEQISSEL